MEQTKVSFESAISDFMFNFYPRRYLARARMGITVRETEAITMPGIEGSGISFNQSFLIDSKST